MKDLNGSWSGFYEYGLGYELPFFGKRVNINLELCFDKNEISGNSKEEKSEYSVDYVATVKGPRRARLQRVRRKLSICNAFHYMCCKFNS